jgi:hypothetical protein
MKNNFRLVKSVIIFGILLLSLFAFFIPTSSAGPLKAPPLIIVQYPPQEKNVIPTGGVLEILLETTIELTGPWKTFVEKSPLLSGTAVQVMLKVEESPPWCDASIANPTVSMTLGETTPRESRLTLTVTEQAPAFQQGTVVVSATSVEQPGLLFSISSATYTYDISFEVGYWPVISISDQKGSYMQVGPLDLADFPITIENIGNGLTYVQIEPEIPEGDWTIGIDASATLASSVSGGAGASKTVHLIIKPPYGFGFHNDIKTFKVKFTPYSPGRPELVGITETRTYEVQSIGISPGTGFEIPSIVVILVIIVLIIYFYRWRKK